MALIQAQKQNDLYEYSVFQPQALEQISISIIKELGEKASNDNITTLVFWKYNSATVVYAIRKTIKHLAKWNIVSYSVKTQSWSILNDNLHAEASTVQAAMNVERGIVPVELTGEKQCYSCHDVIDHHLKARLYMTQLYHIDCAKSDYSAVRQDIRTSKKKSRVVASNIKCPRCGCHGSRLLCVAGNREYIYTIHLNRRKCYCGKKT